MFNSQWRGLITDFPLLRHTLLSDDVVSYRIFATILLSVAER